MDQSIFDFAPFPMWIYDLESFRFLAVNKEAIRSYGYNEKEFLNMTIKDIRPPEDIPRLEKAVKEARTRSELYKESLFRHRKQDGSVIYVKIKSNHISFKGKSAEIVTAIDLTDRYEREQKIEGQKNYLTAIGTISQLLLKTNDWLQSLNTCFKTVGETIGIDRIYFFQNNLKDRTTSQRVEWSNENTIPQLDNQELQNIPFSELPLFMEPLLKKKNFEAIVKDLPQSATKDLLLQLEIKSILVLPLWVNDLFYGFIGFDNCTQEREFSEEEFQLIHVLTSNLGHVIKQLEAFQELSYREAKFKSLIENGQDLIAILDANGYYKNVVSTSKTILGISPDELIGKNAFDFIHKEDIPRLKKQLTIISESKYVTIEPYRFIDANGNWRWIQTELSNHLDTPLIEGIVANTYEVTTEVKKRQIERLAASLTKGIGQPGNLSSCFNQAISQLTDLNGIDSSEIWLVSQDASRLDLISYSFQNEKISSFYEYGKEFNSFTLGSGLPGYIWKENSPMLWRDLPYKKEFVRQPANFNTAMGFPISYNNEFIGCILCFSTNQGDTIVEEYNLLKEVTQLLGPVVKQKITEEEYRNFFNISPDPHCIIGFDGYIKKFNKAFQNLLGYEEEKLLSTPIYHFIHKDDKQESQAILQSSITPTSSLSHASYPKYEARFVTSDGSIKWLVWNGTVIQESKIIVAVAKDITEERLVQEKLEVAYKQLKTAQKIAKLGYWFRDLDSELSVWSEETYRIYGYSPHDFIPTQNNIAQTFHPEDRHLIENDSIGLLDADIAKGFEHRLSTGKGNIKWVHQEIRLLTDKQGQPFRIEGTIQDITERKLYEKELSLSNERFRLAMQASNEIIWELDHQNGIITRGNGGKSMFEFRSNEAYNKNNSWFSKIITEERDNIWETFQETLADKNKSYWNSEYKVKSEKGGIIYLIDRCYILRDEAGKPMRSIGSTLDVTSSREQLNKIKNQNEKLKEIAWLQSHVIRAPLARIMGLINLFEVIDDDEEITKNQIIEMITTSAHELDEVIKDITRKINAEDIG
ncbi:PAS domain S-box protein [Cyclobacterium sp. 1_MG-2023]|uniref:PAS domain S-box protein n=1 Tax=Cyclobacterium sp. 1_MG-2023 TaxID=3062681 RepID=UPI0026E3D079|nr:PAS domain S-box protein [Cyclobacterium sp. 1_MG-2023]MDO6438528.1 PAS domain S-box protein [Cyclobacterium sp. 1_MG-2023]